MAISKGDVYAQAQAALSAIQDLPAKERNAAPSTHFLTRYNEVLELAKEAAPDVDPRLWPPKVVSAQTKLVEYQTFYGQICANVDEPVAGFRA